MIKPIIFNTDMVRAILADRKTVTRRAVKLKYSNTHLEMFTNKYGTRLIEKQNEEPGITTIRNPDGTTTHTLLACIEKEPPYHPGDILYVRETWQYAYDLDGNEQPIEGTGRYMYAADDLPEPFGFWVNPDGTHRDSMPWRPSSHMPREAARIFLRVTDVRVERLQDITEEQAEAEGCRKWYVGTKLESPARSEFCQVWDSTIKATDRALYGWEANPWVWVIEFEQCKKPT